jgi:hypothetical protein
MDYTPAPNIETTLKGHTLHDLRIDKGVQDDRVHLSTHDGKRFRSFDLYHSQDCCESVRLFDVQGDPTTLQLTTLEVKETIVGWNDGTDKPSSWPSDIPPPSESGTVTLFEIKGTRGSREVVVTLRWLGQSNGYYSESVSFVETTNA